MAKQDGDYEIVLFGNIYDEDSRQFFVETMEFLKRRQFKRRVRSVHIADEPFSASRRIRLAAKEDDEKGDACSTQSSSS